MFESYLLSIALSCFPPSEPVALPSKSLSYFFIFFFLKDPPNLNSCFHECGGRVIYWTMGNMPMAITQKKKRLPSFSHH